MSSTPRDSSAQTFVWQGRIDTQEEPQRAQRWHQVVQKIDLTDPERIVRATSAPSEPSSTITSQNTESTAHSPRPLALMGFAVDAGVERNQGRPGAALGPHALRSALAPLPYWGGRSLYDAGDIHLDPKGDADPLAQAQAHLASHVSAALSQGMFPMVLGGGHEVAWGSFLGLTQSLSTALTSPMPPRILIVNFDAHFDLRRAPEPNSGTPFLQIAQWCAKHKLPFNYHVLGISPFANTPALFDRAQELGVEFCLDEDLQSQEDLSRAGTALRQRIQESDLIYLTICLDVLPGYLAPGVSAPAALGLPLAHLEHLLKLVLQSGKVALADIAELNPAYDPQGLTSKIAARLVAQVERHVKHFHFPNALPEKS